MIPGRVALALQVLGRVYPTLRANGVRTLHRNNREQVDVGAHLRDLDHRGQSGESTAYDNDFGSRHVIAPAFRQFVRDGPISRWSFVRSTRFPAEDASGTNIDSQNPLRTARGKAPGRRATASSGPYPPTQCPTSRKTARFHTRSATSRNQS